VRSARQVAWSYIADQNGRYIDADDFETQVVALTKIIEADRASRGTGEREAVATLTCSDCGHEAHDSRCPSAGAKYRCRCPVTTMATVGPPARVPDASREREAGRREANDEGRHTVGRAMKMLGRAIYGALDINCGINGCSNTLYGLVTKACERLSKAAPICDGCQGRGCSGCGGNGYCVPSPAEPPTGHLEVAVRALERIESAAVSSDGSICNETGCGRIRRNGRIEHAECIACGIASRALAALRAAAASPGDAGTGDPT